MVNYIYCLKYNILQWLYFQPCTDLKGGENIKSKYLLILTIIIISCLSIGFVSATDDGVNETIISAENEFDVDNLENEMTDGDDLISQSEDDEILEGIVVNPIPPSDNKGSLTDLKNNIRGGGICFLDRNYTYMPGDSTDGIEINRTLILIGNNFTIDGGNVARLFVINNGSIYISGVNFVNAHSNGNGSAIYYNGASGFINDCTFTNCSAKSGGAIYYDGLSLIVNNTHFKDNSAELGAGMYIISNSTIVMNSTFSNNRASNSGGSVYWKKTSKKINSTYQESDDDSGSSFAGGDYTIAIGTYVRVYSSHAIGYGQYINVSNSNNSIAIGSNLNVNNSYGATVIGQGVNIDDLSGSSYYNGLIVKDGHLAVVNSTFSNDSAQSNGGAIFTSTGVLDIYNSTFTDCESKLGGAIRSFDINVYNSNFTKNNAGYQGGVMYFDGGANIYDSSFTKNTADFQGGALFSGKATKTVNIYNSIFDGNGLKNRAGNYYGGAIYEADLIRSCTFINNYAWSGGAIYQWYYHNPNGRLRIENSTFDNNNAIGTGGAVYAHYGANILYSNFTNNIAGDVGGAVGGWNHISQSCLFINNTAKYGGAIGGESARAYKNLIINSTSTELGGAIYGFNLIINDNLIINSSSKNLGGAIGTSEYFAATSSFNNNIIINAKALKGGAAYFYNYYNDVNTVFNSNKIYNASADIGGAVYTHSFARLSNNIFENTTARIGGVIYNDMELTVKNNTITDSKAELGRDIYNVGKIGVSYLTFIDARNITAEYADVILIFANLTDDMGNTITGQNISVAINNNNYSLPSVEGKISFNYTVDFMNGERVVNGTYDGSNLEKTVIKSGLIRINPPVLSIIKTVEDKRYYDGDNVIYTVIVNNTGKGKAINVVVKDILSKGLKLINTTSNKGKFIDDVWKIDELEIGEIINITYTCLLTSDGLIKNEAIVSCDNADENRSSVTINVRPYQPIVSIEKIAINPIVIVGQKAEFEIVIHNTDNVAVKNLTLTEDMFEGLIFDSYRESAFWKHSIVNGKNVWTLIGDLASKETVSLFVYFNTTTSGTFNNTVVVNGTNLENKTANASVKVLYPHLDAKKVSLMPITKVGNQTMFEIIIFNDGEFDVHNLYVIEDSFEGLAYNDYLHDDLWRHEVVDGKNKWTMVEEFAPGETVGLIVIFDTDKVGNFTNYAIVGSDETVSKTINATVWVNETVQEAEGTNPDMEVKITALHPLVIAGSQIKFEVIVSNIGDTVLNNVTISENSFNGLIFDHMEDHTGIWYQTGFLTANDLLGASDDGLSWKMNVPLYKNETLGFFMVFNTTAPGTFVNSIIGSSDKTEPKIADGDVEVVVPQYTIEKVALNKTVTVGDKVHFEISVKNTGKVNITDLIIIELPGEGLTYDSFVDPQGFWNEGADLTWSIKNSIAPNETVSLFLIFSTDKIGNLTNTIVSEDKTANDTVVVKNKTNETIPNNTTPSDDDSVPDDDAVPDDDSTPSDDEPGKDTSNKPEEDKGTNNSNGSLKTSMDVDKNATGNPILVLLLVILALIFSRRNKK